ncbi:MAG: hypothetical protein V1889_00395 [archaeon]
MGKRVVHIEVGDRALVDTDGLNRVLGGMMADVEDSYDLEDILNNVVRWLYRVRPRGQVNYGGKDSLVGIVGLSRFNNRQGPGNVNIEYAPAERYRKKWGYVQKKIGTINLRERTFSVGWDGEYRESHCMVPKVLMRDTERVMEYLGLKRKVVE